MRFTNGFIMLPRDLRSTYFHGDWAGHAVLVYLLENAEWDKGRVSIYGKGKSQYEVKFGEYAAAKTRISADLGIDRGVLTRCIAKLKRVGLLTESRRVNFSIFKINTELANTIYAWKERKKDKEKPTNEKQIINNKYLDVSKDTSYSECLNNNQNSESTFDSEGTRNIFDPHDSHKNTSPVDDKPSGSTLTPIELARLWNEASGDLPKLRLNLNKLSPKRLKACQLILKRISSESEWRDLITKISKSDWCTGKNPRGWLASFDWLIKDTNNCIDRIAEGGFDNKQTKKDSYHSSLEGISLDVDEIFK